MLSKYDSLSSCSAPAPPPLIGTVNSMTWNTHGTEPVYQCCTAFFAQTFPFTDGRPRSFHPEHSQQYIQRGQSGRYREKIDYIDHTGLKGSGRAGRGLRMKNNICTLGQLHQHCNPNEEADKSLTGVSVVGALLICPQVLSLFHLDASLTPGSQHLHLCWVCP